MYHRDEGAFVNVDGSWIKVSSIEAIKSEVSGKTRIYLTSGNFIDVGSASGHISPDDVIRDLVRACSRTR